LHTHKIWKIIRDRSFGIGISALVLAASAGCDDSQNNAGIPIDDEYVDVVIPASDSGVEDTGMPDCESKYFRDFDGDRFGDYSAAFVCELVQGYVGNNLDCNDSHGGINPGAQEVCDGIDNNCDGDIDEGFPKMDFYLDRDRDTYGDDSSVTIGCDPPNDFYVLLGGDCNDTNPNINPMAPDIKCSGVDENCDGILDNNRIMRHKRECQGGDAYWRDNCGDLGDLAERCAENQVCEDGECKCIPDCTNRECGSDGCEGSCGICQGENSECISGDCVCETTCGRDQCGPDGCGGTCGECSPRNQCVERYRGGLMMVCECEPDCGSLCCWEDGLECLHVEMYGRDICIPPGSDVCRSRDGRTYGFCRPGLVCGEGWECQMGPVDVQCCPPNRAHYQRVRIGRAAAPSRLCCDACYDSFDNNQEANAHCTTPVDQSR